MAGNFIAMVYAVLRDKGVDTKGMEPDEAVAKYEELTGKTGRYSTETGELEEDNKSKIIVPKASGFNRSNTKSHLSHAKEMGLNEKQYIKAAEEFFNNGAGKIYIDRQNMLYKYDDSSGLLCVCDNNGTLHTFFKPKKKNHFTKLIRQFKLEEV